MDVDNRRTARRRNPTVTKQLYRMKELVEMGFGCRAAIYKRIHDNKFPPPIRLGPRSVAWRVNDIEQLLKALAAERDRERTSPAA